MAETNEPEKDEEKRKSFIEQETTYGEPISKVPPHPVPPPVSSSNVDDLTERRIGILALAAMLFLIGVGVGLWIAERSEDDGR